jgi:endoglucanase
MECQNVDFVFPNTSAIDILISKGLNIFRVPFAMERMVPNNLTGPLDQTYFQPYAEVINHITAKGAYAVVDPHNYGR